MTGRMQSELLESLRPITLEAPKTNKKTWWTCMKHQKWTKTTTTATAMTRPQQRRQYDGHQVERNTKFAPIERQPTTTRRHTPHIHRQTKNHALTLNNMKNNINEIKHISGTKQPSITQSLRQRCTQNKSTHTQTNPCDRHMCCCCGCCCCLCVCVCVCVCATLRCATQHGAK